MIWLCRQDQEERESRELGRWAARSEHSGGRRAPEPPDPMRTEFQRDRDRVIHCAAFRRLQHKTQVLAAHEGDHHRTRMTHSLEVSQMARSVAIALRLNADLAEAVALAHDLGHPPFGHAGEEALHELMADHGGFRHNAQGARIVDYLEDRHGRGHGLNLVYLVRRSLLKGPPPPGYPLRPDLLVAHPAPLEAKVVDLCDRIAYLAHDLEDGMRAGAFREAQASELRLWRRAAESARGGAPTEVISELIALAIRDLVDHCAALLAGSGDERPALRHGDAMTVMTHELQAFLRDHFYRATFVLAKMGEGRAKIAQVFARLVRAPHEMPEAVQARIAVDGLERAVCDYVSGMTDRYLLKQ
jgi:dGTPase